MLKTRTIIVVLTLILVPASDKGLERKEPQPTSNEFDVYKVDGQNHSCEETEQWIWYLKDPRRPAEVIGTIETDGDVVAGDPTRREVEVFKKECSEYP